eukprot:1777744-Rhodomonas_salina.1
MSHAPRANLPPARSSLSQPPRFARGYMRMSCYARAQERDAKRERERGQPARRRDAGERWRHGAFFGGEVCKGGREGRVPDSDGAFHDLGRGLLEARHRRPARATRSLSTAHRTPHTAHRTPHTASTNSTTPSQQQQHAQQHTQRQLNRRDLKAVDGKGKRRAEHW